MKPGNPALQSLASPEKGFLEAIKQNKVDAQDANCALEYIRENALLEDWKPGSVDRQYQCIKPILIHMHGKGWDLASLDRPKVLSLIEYLQTHPTWNEASRQGNWERWSRFYKWAAKRYGKSWNQDAKDLLYGDEKYSYKTNRQKIVRKNWFTPADMLVLLSAEREIRYRALFSTMFACGLRIGEAITLQVQDALMGEHGYDIHVRSSKTKLRTVPMYEQGDIVHLSLWLQVHPQRTNPSAPLFLNNAGNPMDGWTANKHLRELSARVFPHKNKVTCHSLRFSHVNKRIEEGWTDAGLEPLLGWSKGSKMCAYYRDENAVDIRKEILRRLGKEHYTPQPIGKNCLQCNNLNPLTATHCFVCKMPLDPKQLDALRHKAEVLEVQSLVEKLLAEKYATLFKGAEELQKAKVRT